MNRRRDNIRPTCVGGTDAISLAPGEDPQAGGGRSKERKKPSDAVAVISYDEKPGIQAIAVGAGNCQIEEERLARRLLALHEIDVTNSSLL
jgi:hypothetical protein